MKKTISILAATVVGSALLMGAAIIGYQDWQKRGSAPGNPASGYFRIWADNTDGKFECLTSAGAHCYFDPAVVPITAGTSVTLAGANQYFVCTSTCTITVPVPAAGVQYCIYNDDNVSTVITLSAIGSSSRYETTARTSYGTAGTGTMVSGGAVGDKVCIVGRDSTHYSTLSYSGTWTVN